MIFEFNVPLDRANCHIRSMQGDLLRGESINERPHKHNFMEFHCVFSGNVIIYLPLEERQIRLAAGQILLLPPGLYHGVMTQQGATVDRLCFNFSAEPAGKENSPIVDLYLDIKEPYLFDDNETAVLTEQCRSLYDQPKGPLLELRQGMHFAGIALNLMSRVVRVRESAPLSDPLALRQKWDIEEYIDHHYTDNTGIDGLARALYLSQRQTSTLVKRYFGEDFKTIIIRRRMELAEIYLQDPDKRLDEIAYEVGYRSYSGFELCFKRYFGMTPQQKRQQLRQKKNAL